jgi:hypothetical protein
VPPKPSFATNRPERGETVAAAVNAVLADVLDHPAKVDHEVCIATAYFNPGGFLGVADQLERAQSVRLLLGAYPAPATERVRALKSASVWDASGGELQRAVDAHTRAIVEDRDLLGFTFEADAAARRLIAWLREGRVTVKRITTDFLHGKAFLVSTDNEAVLAGSSNFTAAGLFRNRELNLGVYQPESVAKVAEWFDEQWEAAEDFDLAAVYDNRFEPHQPYLVFLRMLWEKYGEELLEEAEDDKHIDRIHLTSFQRDGVWRARRMLDEHHGVLIADGVGLGKTFVGGALLDEYVRGRRQRALIVAPAALRDGPWEAFVHHFALPVTLISFDEFLREMQGERTENGKGRLRAEKEDYSLVVVDEAHALRNPDALRSKALREFLAGSPPKDLVLMTATPVNNTVMDLHVLLSYFLRDDSVFASRGIPSMVKRFQQADAQDPDDLSPELLFDIIDAVSVRRTRHFVKRYYADATVTVNGVEQKIHFPDPKVLTVNYEVTADQAALFEDLQVALDVNDAQRDLDDPSLLTLARYAPSRYAVGDAIDGYELQLAGLLRSGLLKRYESSAHAFALTCKRMADGHDAFLSLLAEGHVATGDALRMWAAGDEDPALLEGALHGETEDARHYDVDALKRDATRDRALLLKFAERAATVTATQDPKIARLVEELVAIAAQAADDAISTFEERTLRKVIVFSYYADTIEWVCEEVARRLEADDRLSGYRGRIAVVTGSDGIDKTEVLHRFAPISTEAPAGTSDDFDLVLTTDVLAEGVNLQQARHIINYDLPWNPMRLVQRHGRIDRIGSQHPKVFLRCFFPDKNLDELLQLIERLTRKLKQAAASIGVEGEALPGSQISDHIFAETRDQIEQLRSENPELFEQGGETGSAYSGEEYRQELRAAFEDHRTEEQVLALPWGSGSGMVKGAEPGYVFCARVGDHPQPVFRWMPVSAVDDPTNGGIAGELLTCLAKAHADVSTIRELPDELASGVFRAWEVARGHIHARWTEATDPAKLQPRVPKPMRDAAALITRTTPPEMTRVEADELVNRLNGNYNQRIQAVFRAILRSDDHDTEKARQLAEQADEFGLQAAPAPEPLPAITTDDVHLVCWLAVVVG